jgi:hypothetical protein
MPDSSALDKKAVFLGTIAPSHRNEEKGIILEVHIRRSPHTSSILLTFLHVECQSQTAALLAVPIY